MFSNCNDGSCCCVTLRVSISIISSINLLATALDILICENRQNRKRDIISEQVASLKSLLVTIFQFANGILLLATVMENAILIQLYVWYSLGYVVLGLMLTLIDFVSKYQDYGCISLIDFIADVVYFFVTFRSMLMVDMYRKHLSSYFVNV